MSEAKLGGRFTFPGTSLTVQRMGYGAMQLAGPGIYGPPKVPGRCGCRFSQGRRGRRRPHRHASDHRFVCVQNSSHLRENLAAARLTLSTETLAELDGIVVQH